MAIARPGLAPHASFEGALRAVYNDERTRLVAIEADCSACRNAGGHFASLRPRRLWADLDAELTEMRARGEHRRVITPNEVAETLGEPPPAATPPLAHRRAEVAYYDTLRRLQAGEVVKRLSVVREDGTLEVVELSQGGED